MRREIQYLCVTIIQSGIQTNTKKTETLKSMFLSINCKQVTTFSILHFTFCRVVRSFVYIKKEKNTAQRSFNLVKEALLPLQVWVILVTRCKTNYIVTLVQLV